jgi:hypothetical protein
VPESDPPGTVSNQNQEEAESGLSDERSQPNADHKDARKEHGGRYADDSPGSAGEGSQSTGHPDNAG